MKVCILIAIFFLLAMVSAIRVDAELETVSAEENVVYGYICKEPTQTTFYRFYRDCHHKCFTSCHEGKTFN